MKIKDLTAFLETIAPPVYQETYDNAGLLVGDAAADLKGVLICLDVTEAIIEEALDKGCNLIIAHHPIIFRGLKKLTGSNYVERTVIKAIKNDLALYAIHTNLDNMHQQGVNAKICEKLGLLHTRILAPKPVLKKLAVLVSPENLKITRNLLINTGITVLHTTEQVSYSEDGSEAAIRLEAIIPQGLFSKIQNILSKNDLVAEWTDLETKSREIGAGMIGELPKPMAVADFLKYLKEKLSLHFIKYTSLNRAQVHTIAVCGGAGSFLLPDAIAQQADVFVSADFKYHEFFDAEGKIVIADIGHFESEQFTIELLYEIISKKFSNFALHCTDRITNPVNYL